MLAFRDALKSISRLFNRLNVYPVPDGDTGTNMALTLDAWPTSSSPWMRARTCRVCKAIGHGSLMGARALGVILSQLLRGIAEGLLP